MSSTVNISLEEGRIFVPPAGDLDKAPFMIYLVGCGGNGSHLASSLARWWYSQSAARQFVSGIYFVDHDVVEEKNIGRQLFKPADVGKNKAQVLASRYSKAYGQPIQYFDRPYDLSMLGFRRRTRYMVIGAVDKAAVRNKMYDDFCVYNHSQQGERNPPIYWLDVGNHRSIGQIAWGNTGDVKQLEGEIGQPAYIERVPYPPMAYPGIIDLSKDEEVLDDAGSCAEAMEANVQGLNINLMMATLASEMVRRFFEGNLSVHAVEVDLDSFATVSQPLTDSWLRLIVERNFGDVS